MTLQLKYPRCAKWFFVQGKFYYDLLAQRQELNRSDVALVRIEQLFPLPVDQIEAV